MARISLSTIEDTLKNTGWRCDSREYKNLKTPMQFRCPEGHLVENTWERLRRKLFCPTCATNVKLKIVDVQPKKKVGDFRVLALDQSSKKTGWSVYDDGVLVGYGLFETERLEPFERIEELCDWLNSMLVGWKPDLVGIEDIQYNPRSEYEKDGISNHNTFKLLGQVMGAVIITILRHQIPVTEVHNKVWKGHCKIKGRSRADQKRSAQILVKKWHDITIGQDESDAICIGKYFAETIKTVSDKKEGIGDF